MFTFNKIFIIIALILFVNSFAIANDKIAYINIDQILSESNNSKLLLKELKKEESVIINNLNIKEKKFKNDENKILSSKKILSKEEYEKQVNIFKKDNFDYNLKKKKILEDLEKKRTTKILNFIKKINPIIENYMNANSIGILIEKKSIFISKPNYDITKNIIEIINNELE